ncbi:hypothetical protein [Nocardia sp. CC227C]|uniref:hypothetical protein n=1 Tax=Nocardia sp. CC227C TaxID=3044562 RepID=UPI00278C3985|nr:hypothetical protein [Nocardia sp. CC227C]
MPPLVWPASVCFAAVLGFRIGVWWQRTNQPGRHEFVPGQHHGDETETVPEHSVDELDEPTDPMPRPPASPHRRRRPSVDDDTEVLPQLQDIRPPSRATPIWKPPWVDRPQRPRHRR